MFKHHPDGYIIIGDLVLPLDEFLLEAPDYALPAGYVGREYMPDERHVLQTDSRAISQPLQWPEGDRYIANIELYRANHEARRAPASPTQEELEHQARVVAAADAMNAADVAAIVRAAESATTVNDLRAQVAELARLLGRLAQAQGLTPTVE